jgi:hypothetical protein
MASTTAATEGATYAAETMPGAAHAHLAPMEPVLRTLSVPMRGAPPSRAPSRAPSPPARFGGCGELMPGLGFALVVVLVILILALLARRSGGGAWASGCSARDLWCRDTFASRFAGGRA